MALVLTVIWLTLVALAVFLVGLVALQLFVTFCGRGPSKESRASLYGRIAQFYDATSGLWEQVWGEHMHHGWYGRDGKAGTSNHKQAQIDMIDETLRFGKVTLAALQPLAGGKKIRVLDAGCGVGGSSRHIARALGAENVDITGVSLSPHQVASARKRTEDAGLSHCVKFQIANAMQLPFPDNHFDFIWSMESGEHMPDKKAFIAEMTRVLKPGGTFLMATWCHRDLDERGPLSKSEKYHLKLMCHNYCLPKWVPVADYVAAGKDAGLRDIVIDDWTPSIMPFWPAVIRSALLPSSMLGLLRAGWLAVRGALTAALMLSGFKRKLLVFAMFTAHK